MNNGEKLQSLENKVMLLQYELEVIKSIVSSNSCSNASSLEKAYRKGFKPSPYGEGLDVIRLLDLLCDLGLLE
ncbi:hypothetical protein [Gilliamella sp. Pas-s95]|uniref:hypothetical protein n=1 Tax=Gilliamella sp. Pas-s95 TaxID=2687317 RepID=UPI001322A3EE|nr:hypothetical protein [Gilliamella sp. Pas-s95]MWN06309.1 hypothetical protein [Gilliamella sp. Pas-s95]